MSQLIILNPIVTWIVVQLYKYPIHLKKKMKLKMTLKLVNMIMDVNTSAKCWMTFLPVFVKKDTEYMM